MSIFTTEQFNLEPLKRLSADLRNATKTMGRNEARFLVDTYYQIQANRIRSAAQVLSMANNQEPHETLVFFQDQMESLESQIKRALDAYSLSTEVGVWSRSICGIGPVIAAGLLAHIDITRAPTVGHIWSFGGFDPTTAWKGKEDSLTWIKQNLQGPIDEELVCKAAKEFGRNYRTLLSMATRDFRTGETKALSVTGLANALARRPWNADLKVLFYKIGESFVKVKGRKSDIYGKYYTERKVYEQAKNEAGEYAELAATILAAKSFRADTKAKAAYEKGKLPDGHIHARCRRYAVKLFLAHWHEVAYRAHYGKEPPAPYPIAHMGHAHKIEVPAFSQLEIEDADEAENDGEA